MNKQKNNLFPITPNGVFPGKSSRIFVPFSSTYKKTCPPNDPPRPNGETSLFIVDWQLPMNEMRDIDKSGS